MNRAGNCVVSFAGSRIPALDGGRGTSWCIVLSTIEEYVVLEPRYILGE